METPPVQRIGRPRLADSVLAVVSAVLMASSFHHQNLFWLAWFGLVPLLYTLRGQTCAARLKLVLGFAVVFHGALNLYIPVTIFKARVLFPYSLWQAVLVSAAAWAGVILVTAIATAAFGLALSGWESLFKSSCSPPVIAVLWAATEYLRSLSAFGYTWGDLGCSQVPWNAMLGVAALAGSFGLSCAVVWLNASMVEVIVRRSRSSWLALGAGIACIGALVLAANPLGDVSARYDEKYEEPYDVPVASMLVRIVQPNFSNDVKLDAKLYQQNVEEQIGLSKKHPQPARLILWPETAIVAPLLEDRATLAKVERLARDTMSELVVGTLDRDFAGRQYNAAVAISPAGMLDGIYRKGHLVPFGEYVPMRSRWKFMDFFSFRDPEFTAGGPRRLLPSAAGPLGVTICFESMFPGISRELTLRGARLLTVLTNDEWLAGTPAPRLHLAMAQMRAAENGRYVLQAANSGISAAIDDRGRIVGQLGEGRKGTLDAMVVGRTGLTPYTRIGEWWIVVALCLFFVSSLCRLLTVGVSEAEMDPYLPQVRT